MRSRPANTSLNISDSSIISNIESLSQMEEKVTLRVGLTLPIIKSSLTSLDLIEEKE
jgi:hypothetical protein